MFFLARLRVVAFLSLLLASVSHSREDSLFTSSVTYCNPPESLLIQQFDVAYFARNQSIFFNISAASVQANVNVTANLLVSVYGLNPVNVTIDLCSILSGALCPLPMYNFEGTDTITLPSTLDVASKIPGIAFKIPDLEGFAQLILTEVSTGNVKACVQATLSNGWSTHQPAVQWATGGLALAALISAAWQSISPDALAPYRLVELLYLYQTIAMSSFLNLNYPTVYRSFTLNFAWALGLFSSTSIQNSIDKMRHLTGGNLANSTSSAAVGLVNRKLSPYSVSGSTDLVIPQPIMRRLSEFDFGALTNFVSTNMPVSTNLADLQQTTVQDGIQTVTAASSNILQAGVPIYVNSIHIATANAFMTTFLCALIFLAIALGIALLGYGILVCTERFSWGSQTRRTRVRSASMSFLRAWFLRFGLIVSTPIIVLAFYQWTLKDSWLSILISVIAFVIVFVGISYPTFLTMRLGLQSTAAALYSDTKHLASSGPLYAQYRTSHYYFFLITLFAALLKALFIAFVNKNGEIQVILLVVVEGLVLIAHIVLRPQKTRRSDVFSTFLAIIRLVCTGLMIAFVESLEVKPIPRVAIGIVAAVIFSVTVIVMFLNLVANSGLPTPWQRKDAPLALSSSSLLENGHLDPLDDTKERRSSSDHHQDADFPTPEERSAYSHDSSYDHQPFIQSSHSRMPDSFDMQTPLRHTRQ